MSSLLINLVFLVLSVLPGAIVVSHVFKWRLLDARSIIFGILFWNFAFASLSVLVGCVSTYLNFFYYGFTALSVLVIVLWILKTLVRRGSFKLGWRLFDMPFVVLIAVLLVYVGLVMAFHPIFMEYDALYAYLPYAKGLTEVGGFYTNSFLETDTALARMPLMPLYYAWGLTVFGAESFRLIPFISILLSVFVIYQISRELFPDRRVVSLMAPAVFLTLPAVLTCISIYSLYVDLPLMAFTAAAVCCAVMAAKYKQLRYYLFTGVSVTLAIFSKEGGYIALLLAICILSLQFSRKYRLLAFLGAASPFYFFIIKNAMTLDLSSSLYLISVVYKQVPIIILLTVLATVLFFACKDKTAFTLDSLKKLLFLLVPLSALAFFMLRNYLYFGAAIIYSNFVTNTISVDGPLDAFSFLRFDLLFTSTGLGSIYIVLFVAGLLCVAWMSLRRKSLAAAVLGIWVVLLLMDWSYFFNFQYLSSEVRRLLILSPFVATAISLGFSCVYDKLSRKKSSENQSLVFGFLLVLLMLGCISAYQLSFARLSGTYLSYVGVPDSDALLTLMAFVAGVVVCVVLFAVVYVRSRVSIKLTGLKLDGLTSSKRRRTAIIGLVLVGVFCVCLVPLNVVQMISDVNEANWDINEYERETTVSYYVDYLPEILDYYKYYLNDDYVTVTYGRQPTALEYFLDRPVIDLRQGVGKYDFLRSNITDVVLSGLQDSDVRYFLVPIEEATWYSSYIEKKDDYVLFNLIENDNSFELLKNFTCYTLYKFVPD